MIISANGIVFNRFGEVLLVQRDDTRTFAAPGGASELNELPPDTAVREVREETGLIVFPVRLVGLYYLPLKPSPYLTLCFRCIQRGGVLTTSDESLQTGFYAADPIDRPILPIHRREIMQAYEHHGGPLEWSEHRLGPVMRLANVLLNNVIYPWLGRRRRQAGKPDYVPPPQWSARAIVVIADKQGRALWLRTNSDEQWSLPATAVFAEQPPWRSAEALLQTTFGQPLALENLTGVYLRQDNTLMDFVFTASFTGDLSALPTNAAFFISSSSDGSLRADHSDMVENAFKNSDSITYKTIPVNAP